VRKLRKKLREKEKALLPEESTQKRKEMVHLLRIFLASRAAVA
jgi:hypothetical protein